MNMPETIFGKHLSDLIDLPEILSNNLEGMGPISYNRTSHQGEIRVIFYGAHNVHYHILQVCNAKTYMDAASVDAFVTKKAKLSFQCNDNRKIWMHPTSISYVGLDFLTLTDCIADLLFIPIIDCNCNSLQMTLE